MDSKQTLTYDPDAKTLTWGSATTGSRGLVCEKYERQQTGVTAPQGTDPFGSIFRGNKFSQASFPFCGFIPGKMNLYDPALAASGAYELGPTGTGTPGVDHPLGNENEGAFGGRLIFEFPTADSQDYIRLELGSEQPSVPLGLTGQSAFIAEKTTHTDMISSVSDRMRSWSVTLGLSAGIEKSSTSMSPLPTRRRSKSSRRPSPATP